MESVLLVVLLLLVAVAVVTYRRRSQTGRPAERPAPAQGGLHGDGPMRGRQATVTLDVVAADPDSPAAQRLVHDAASHVFRTSPDIEAVTVQDRVGMRLGMVVRDQRLSRPLPPTPDVVEPGRRPSRRSSASSAEPAAPGSVDDWDSAPRRSLAERFDLPGTVHAHLRRPDDPLDIVRAILEAAGLVVEVHGNVLRSGDEAVIVVSDTSGSPSEALTNAFLRFQKSGASRGVVIVHGYVGGRDIERRQALAPNLRYTGLSAIQRMADAVALGGNPLMFATEAAITNF